MFQFSHTAGMITGRRETETPLIRTASSPLVSSSTEEWQHVTKQVKQLDRVIIRFAGDSGDGMQLTGDRFTQESAAFGNDLVTLPNFPAEIRAPQGTLPGVCLLYTSDAADE